MASIGIPELIVIAMILLVVFGASRLPRIGESVGRAVGKLKRGVDGAEPPAEVDEPEDADIVDR